MKLLNDTIVESARNLGSLDNLQGLTHAIVATTGALANVGPELMLADLQHFGEFLDRTGAAIARLDQVVRMQVFIVQGGSTDAG